MPCHDAGTEQLAHYFIEGFKVPLVLIGKALLTI